MGKKMKFSFLSKSNSSSSSSSWPWPSCHQPRTLSFRTDINNNETLFKTINSAYLDAIVEAEAEAETDNSWFSASSKSASSFDYSTTATSDESQGTDPVETVIRGLRSENERLFFEPGETSSLILAEEEATKLPNDENESLMPFKESVVLSMESRDPYVDFRKSMEEMVEALGLRDWDCLEQLLCWYLRANGKTNHGYIFGAFVDLLVGLAISSSSTAPSSSHCNNSLLHSPSSPLSFYTSSSSSSEISSTTTPCVSSLEEADELEEIDNITTHSCLSSLPGKEIIQGDDDSCFDV